MPRRRESLLLLSGTFIRCCLVRILLGNLLGDPLVDDEKGHANGHAHNCDDGEQFPILRQSRIAREWRQILVLSSCHRSFWRLSVTSRVVGDECCTVDFAELVGIGKPGITFGTTFHSAAQMEAKGAGKVAVIMTLSSIAAPALERSCGQPTCWLRWHSPAQKRRVNSSHQKSSPDQ